MKIWLSELFFVLSQPIFIMSFLLSFFFVVVVLLMIVMIDKIVNFKL